MTSFEKAWDIVKEEVDMAKAKAAIISCLKKEGGAAGLDKCCEAANLSKEQCRSVINSMDNVKTHKNGDIILMDGL